MPTYLRTHTIPWVRVILALCALVLVASFMVKVSFIGGIFLLIICALIGGFIQICLS